MAVIYKSIKTAMCSVEGVVITQEGNVFDIPQKDLDKWVDLGYLSKENYEYGQESVIDAVVVPEVVEDVQMVKELEEIEESEDASEEDTTTEELEDADDVEEKTDSKKIIIRKKNKKRR